MRAETVIKRTDGVDMIPLFAGVEDCACGYSFGPHIRNYFLVHYCLSGKGRLCDKLGEHKISEGELFIIRPGEVTTYTADEKEPWRYVWIAFEGTKSSVFSAEKSVYSCPSEPFMRIFELICDKEECPDIYISLIYDMIYRLFTAREHDTDTLSSVRKYIKYNYMMDITAEKIAESFGYERTYLYRIFKRRYGTGIKAYIIKTRMENAKEFLLEGHSVGESALLSGYTDEFNFSRAYKKYFGIAPSHTKAKFQQ